MTDDGTGGLFVNPSGLLTSLDAVIILRPRSLFVMAKDTLEMHL